MITKHKFSTEKWYISTDTPYIYGKLEIDELGIIIEEEFNFN